MKFNIERITTLPNLLLQLAVGLKDITIVDNFKNFEVDVTIPATSELRIVNQFDFIPTRYIIVSQTGNGLITKGTTDWSKDAVYLYNNGSVQVTAKVAFLR